MSNISNQSNPQSLSQNEVDAITNYMNDKDAHTQMSTHIKGRLIIVGGQITYHKTVQNVWDRFFRFIGQRTEKDDIREIGEKRIQKLGNLDTIDPRFLSLFKSSVASHSETNLTAFTDNAEQQFGEFIQNSGVTLQQLHPYIQAFGSKHLEKIISSHFKEDAENCLIFFQRLYNSALLNPKSKDFESMVISFGKLMAALPNEIIDNNKADFENITSRVVDKLCRRGKSIITQANANNVPIGAKAVMVRLLADLVEIAQKYPDNKNIKKWVSDLLQEVNSSIEEGLLMPLDASNREAICSIARASLLDTFKPVMGNISAAVRTLLEEGYKKAIVGKNVQEAKRIIMDLPDVIRAQLIIPLMESRSNKEELVMLFNHFPKGPDFSLPKEYIKKAVAYCKKALNEPIDYKALDQFLPTLPEKEQEILLQSFFHGKTRAARVLLHLYEKKALQSFRK